MNKFITILVLILALTSCKTTSGLPTSERDGSSYEKAVIVKNIKAEYKYAMNECADCEFLGQVLVHHKGKTYDILKYRQASGDTVKYYFDINNFFEKEL